MSATARQHTLTPDAAQVRPAGVADTSRAARAPHLRAITAPRAGSDRERAMAQHPSAGRAAARHERPVLRAVVEAEVVAGAAALPTEERAEDTYGSAAATAPRPEAASVVASPDADASPDPAVEATPVERAGWKDDPEQLCAALALCVVEILAGARALDQVAYWVTDAVYIHLLRRSVIAARARAVAAEEAMRPRVRIGAPRLFQPRDGVVEAVVMVHQNPRSRAMTMRLERHRSRWRATALSVL